MSRDLTYIQRKERIEKKKRRDEEARLMGLSVPQRQRPPASSPLNVTAAMTTGTPTSAAIHSAIPSPAVSSGYIPHPLMSVTSSVASAIRNFIPGAPLAQPTVQPPTVSPVAVEDDEAKNGG